ncbi:ribonuclease Oy [Zophobas morio]|uniref:ribonuclease Oy n=1 Tax=Zophobas morio TaxID=2755281 RepID=UPI003082C924
MFYILAALILLTVNPSISENPPEKKPKPSPTPFQDWDYIVYSQRWPITGCSQWEERSSQNTCSLPHDNTTWTVHGLWPTKIGANGPFFCNSAIHFDPDQLAPMMKELQEYWTNVEANTKPNSLWKHEWNKHGTCAASLPQLNSVTNYFKQGLEWNQDFRLSSMLSKSNIVPNTQGYNISDVYNAVKVATGKNPEIECVVDGKSKQSLISEIRLCFNKSLDLIDCNVSKFGGQDGDILSNCNGNKNVMYFATVPNNTYTEEVIRDVYFDDVDEPNLEICIEYFNFQGRLLKLYSIIKFLMWFTL